MSEWIKASEDTYIPDWLKGSFVDKCPYCGADMLNYYNDDYRCTNRKCSNDTCPGTLAARADFMRNLIGLRDMGFSSCYKDITIFGITNQLQLLPVWNVKPKVSLGTFLRMHCFDGVDSEWDTITQKLDIYTLDELYEKYDGKWSKLLQEKKDLLYDDLKVVELESRPVGMANGPKYVITIMITGTPIGFSTKDDFINTVNEACAGKIKVIHQKTKRQTGVDCLIREPGSTTRGKVEAAEKGGIPILTSEQFLTVIKQMMEEE